MKYGSLCSGISAETVAWSPLGWEPAFFAEIEPFPRSVLAYHYPDVPNRGDITQFNQWPDEPVDLVCGGTPCQSFSVAGLRKGMADPRGNLALVFLAIVAKYQPRWVVWENVCGVLSSNGGRDFGAFLGGLEQCGYGWAYRTLDAQFVRVDSHARAVPQRRNRVFVVGHIGGQWQRAAAVLFERAGLRGDSAPRRTAGKEIAPCLRGRANCSHRADTETFVAESLRTRRPGEGGINGDDSHIIPEISPALNTQSGQHHAPDTKAYICFDTTQVTSDKNFSNPKPGDPCHPLAKGSHAPTIAFPQKLSNQSVSSENVACCIESANPTAVASKMAVRRLTPRECERLMGHADDYTLVPHNGKPAKDGPRYKALGNGQCVNVMRWIGERIRLVEELCPP